MLPTILTGLALGLAKGKRDQVSLEILMRSAFVLAAIARGDVPEANRAMGRLGLATRAFVELEAKIAELEKVPCATP